MNEVYAVQSVVNIDIKLLECNLETKLHSTHKDIKKMKLEIQETEQRKMELEGNCHKISKEVSLTCKNFEEEGKTKEMTPDSKITQLDEIADDLRRKVTKLEEKRRLSMPPEVLESRRDAPTQATKRIEEA